METTILITGASTGIGRELAHIAAEKQHNIVLVARNEQKLKDLCEQIRKKHAVKADYMVADLSAAGSAQKLYNDVVTSGHKIDYLVNNAGFGDYGNFVERDLEKFRQMIHLNITTLTELTYLFAKDMVAVKRGGILNIASTASMQPDPYMAVYGATKSYVANFTEALSYELKGTGVTATVLSPGATVTEFFDAAEMAGSRMTGSRMMSAKDVAKLGYHALIKGKLHVIAGWKNKLMGLGSQIMPSGNLKLAIAAAVLKKK